MIFSEVFHCRGNSDIRYQHDVAPVILKDVEARSGEKVGSRVSSLFKTSMYGAVHEQADVRVQRRRHGSQAGTDPTAGNSHICEK